MRVVHHAHEWATHHKDGARVALVPTMGNLHAGHIALVEHAAAIAEKVVVSIFVNPLQFSEGEDFARYPRTLAADVAALSRLHAANRITIFAPDARAFIRDIPVPTVPDSLIHTLCGLSRPRLFPGVIKVVALLLEVVRPNIAVFGEKDWQQLQVVRAMAEHLDVTIHSVPILREPDGLALSSRNQYLDAPARAKACGLYETLSAIQHAASSAITNGEGDRRTTTTAATNTAITAAMANAIADGKQRLTGQGIRVEYLCVLDETTLQPIHFADKPADNAMKRARIFIAAWLDDVRLIDNAPLLPSPAA